MFKSSSSDEFTLSDLSRSKTQPPYWRFGPQLGKTFLLKRFSCISHRKNRTDLNLAILRGRLLIHFLLFPGFWTKIFPLVSIKVFIFVIMGLSNMTWQVPATRSMRLNCSLVLPSERIKFLWRIKLVQDFLFMLVRRIKYLMRLI